MPFCYGSVRRFTPSLPAKCSHARLLSNPVVLGWRLKQKGHSCECPNRQLPILPGRLQPSTFGVYVLNYCVRNGNRWCHIAIITGYFIEGCTFSRRFLPFILRLQLIFMGNPDMGYIRCSTALLRACFTDVPPKLYRNKLIRYLRLPMF